MSLLDDVSIVVTPNGYKAGELYAVIPVPTEGAELVVNGDFATDSDWTKGTGWSIANGKATSAGSNFGGQLKQTILETNKIYLLTFDIVDYTSGVLALESSYYGETQLFSGIGSYTAYFNSSSQTELRLYSQNFNGSIDNVSVKEYTSADMDVTRATAATRVDENGLVADVLSNVPRIDYTGGGCPHILAEPQRTNLVTYSEDFSHSSWLRQNLTVELNSAVSPSGDSNASKLVEASSNTTHRILTGAGLTISGDVSISVFAKKGERNWIKLLNNNLVGAFFDLENGVIGSVGGGIDAKIENYGNGWYRCSFTATAVANERIGIYTSIDGINLTYQGDGTSGVYVYGGQLEVGSYPTSYIPTSGSTVTRNQDIFTRDGIGSLINSTEGVLFVEMAALDNNLSSNKIISLSDGTTSNRLLIYYTNIDNTIKWFSQVGGSIQVDDGVVLSDITQFSKIAFKYKLNDYSLWVDGVEVGSYTSGSSFPADTLNSLALDDGGGSSKFYGKVKQLQVYDTSLSDTQLAALTS